MFVQVTHKAMQQRGKGLIPQVMMTPIPQPHHKTFMHRLLTKLLKMYMFPSYANWID